MPYKTIRILGIASLFLFTAIACQLFSDVDERVESVRGTAESVATTIGDGRDLLATAQALSTQVGGSGMIATVQALATQAGESGFLATAEAFATAEGPELVETALAAAKQKGPSVLATAQAYITQSAEGGAPSDIPVIEGDKEMFFQSAELVSYVIGVPYTQAVEFYKTQMPANGWTKVEQDWSESEAAANLAFDKPDRRASVVLTTSSGGSKTIVLVTIEKK